MLHVEVFCLFVSEFSFYSRNFHSHRDVTIIGEELQGFACARHLSQIAWANVGILLAVFFARRWKMTLAPCQFAHRADLFIANGSFDDVGPTPLAQQALQIYANVMPNILFQVSRRANVDSINIYSISRYIEWHSVKKITATSWYCISKELKACSKELSIW